MEELTRMAKAVREIVDKMSPSDPDEYTLRSDLLITFENFVRAYADCIGAPKNQIWEMLARELPQGEEQ